MDASGVPARRLARLLAGLWFQVCRREGPELPAGPNLVLLNHPNGLLDPRIATG